MNLDGILQCILLWFVLSVPAAIFVARTLAVNGSVVQPDGGASVPVFVYIDATTGRSIQVILPDDCEPCMMCNGAGDWSDEWGEHVCEECDGDGFVQTGRSRGYETIFVEEEDDAPPTSAATMYDSPLL